MKGNGFGFKIVDHLMAIASKGGYGAKKATLSIGIICGESEHILNKETHAVIRVSLFLHPIIGPIN